jgi:hypothetical protein
MTEAKQAEETKKERRVEREIETAAPIEKVCKALADGKELARCFPLEARVTSGVGGKIFVSWGPAFEGPRDKIEVQAWLSAFALDPGQGEASRQKWERRLQEIFPSTSNC